MSDNFKKNSRFGMLAGDNQIKNVMKKGNSKSKLNEEKTVKNDGNNSFKRPSNDKNQRNSLTNTYSKENIEKMHIEEKKKKQEKDRTEIKNSLSMENFPALSTISNNNTVTNNRSFLEKLKTTNDDSKSDSNCQEIKPGWVSITKDHLTNKPKLIYNPSHYSSLKQDKGEIEVAYDVLYSLCNLYEKRTAEYIEMYGYDTWEKMFKFHNYDYDWVDKLDEEYELEMEKLFNEEDDHVSEEDEFY